MGNSIKAIMLDLGNVSINFNHRMAVDKISHLTDKGPGDIYQLFFDSPITGLFEEGKISPRDFYARVKKMLGINISYKNFLNIWNEIFFLTEDNLKIHNLIKGLKGRIRLIMVSNINALHHEYLSKKYDIFRHFDNVVLSCEVGARKPDPVIYKKAFSFLADDERKSALYIDDREDLVLAAQKLGIRSVVFSGYAKLEKDLNELGLTLLKRI